MGGNANKVNSPILIHKYIHTSVTCTYSKCFVGFCTPTRRRTIVDSKKKVLVMEQFSKSLAAFECRLVPSLVSPATPFGFNLEAPVFPWTILVTHYSSHKQVRVSRGREGMPRSRYGENTCHVSLVRGVDIPDTTYHRPPPFLHPQDPLNGQSKFPPQSNSPPATVSQRTIP